MIKIKNNISNTITIDKSIFITNIFLVNTIEEINEIINTIKKKYYDANHNCYAYILDDGMIQKCSDDKEPAKTAGYPMLDVLKKQNITNVLAITTRYFGGVKLGAGGLLRAYSTSVSIALENSEFTTIKEFYKYNIIFDYSYYNNISLMKNITIIESNFSDNISLIILIDNEEILEELKNLTLGKVLINFIEKVKLDV